MTGNLRLGEPRRLGRNHPKIAGPVLLSVLLCVFLIYRPALNGPFVFDDGPNLLKNDALHLSSLNPKAIRFALENVQAGPFGRPVAYATFALNYYFFGPDPYSFKFVNLIIHLLNGVCVFLLTRLLLRAIRLGHRVHIDKQKIQWIAVATAGLWMLHPLALTSVLYIVQRMNSLAALFSLLTLIGYFSGRLGQFTGRSGIPEFAAAFGILAPLAVLSKDSAILIPGFLLVADWLLLRLKTRSRGGRLITRGLLLSTIMPVAAALLLRDDVVRSVLAGYERQPFTLFERVLTESRVLWVYLKLVFIPDPAAFGLYHDDIPLSKGLFQPVTTILSITGLLFLAAGAVIFRNKAPVLSFAILFFLIGHSIESSIFSLEIAHEHRNYLPMIGLVFVVCHYALHPRLSRNAGRAAVAGLILFIGLSAAITIHRALEWRDLGSLALSLAEHHPHSARSNYEAGRLFTSMIEEDLQAPQTSKYYQLARRYFTSSYESDEFNPAGLFGILYLDSLLAKPADPGAVAELRRRLSDNPILPATPSSFSSLFNCREKRICRMDRSVLLRLYETALNNPRAAKKTRASLFNELAMLHLEQGDAGLAVQLFKRSIGLNPSQPQLRFNLVHVLITSGRLKEAGQELKLIREKFPNVREEHKLASLERMFANASGGSN